MANSASTYNSLIRDSLQRTARLVVPSLPFAGLFMLAVGILVYAAGALPEGGGGSTAFALLAFATLFAHSLFSVSMYHAVVPAEAGKLMAAWKLSLSWILIIVVAAIGASIIVLFFALIGASLGVGASEEGQTITDMTAEMRQSGTFWPLFGLFIAMLLGVFWFAVRMMTFAAATSARGSVHVFRTWYWTKGHFRLLAPIMVLLVALPIIAFGYLGSVATTAFVGVPETPWQAGLGSAITMIVLLPSAWLGHGFAASVYTAVAPEIGADAGA